jgi:phosphatidylglycerol:prolipoprotein diacylglycerol transferase
MLQELFHFHLGSRTIPIYAYGLMMVIGFLAAAHLAKHLAGRCGLNGELFINAALIGLLGGIVGARLSHIIENLGEFTRSDRTAWQNLVNMIDLRSGGLTYYGGFLLAFPTLVGYGLWKRVPVRLGMDIVAPCLMVGLGFGRIGCFLNGCCYGAPCDLPWAVRFPYCSNAYVDQVQSGVLTPPAGLVKSVDGRATLRQLAELGAWPELAAAARQQRSLPIHPTQLYSALTAFLLAGLLLAYFTLPHVAGHGFAVMLMLEGASRFLLECVRAEPAVAGPLSLGMVVGLAMIPLGAVLWIVFTRMGQEPRPWAGPAAAI